PAPVALLADDAEVAELQLAALADEHVHWREITVQQLAAVQLPAPLEDARDAAPGRGVRPRLAGLVQERAEVTEAGVLEREVIEHAAVGPHQRKSIEHLHGPRMAPEERAEA